MQYTTFGRTGLTVSRLCLGTGTFGKQADAQEAFRIFDRATLDDVSIEYRRGDSVR